MTYTYKDDRTDKVRHEEMLEVLQNSWHSCVEDLVEEFECDGYEEEFEVIEFNNEYIMVATEEDDQDIQYQLKLAGTKRTIVIESIERFEI